jgi:hypothetical protein
MNVQPLYAANDQQPAFALRYSWTGWVTRGDSRGLATTGDAWTNLIRAWESDGLRLLDHLIRDNEIHLTLVMPDHVHIALRGNLDHSPEQIALSFQNNLAHMLDRGAVWRNSYYVGTFGVYDMRAIRMAGQTSCSAKTS